MGHRLGRRRTYDIVFSTMYPPDFEQRVENIKQSTRFSNCIGAAYFLMGVGETRERYKALPSKKRLLNHFDIVGTWDPVIDAPIPEDAEAIGVFSTDGWIRYEHLTVFDPKKNIPRELIERSGCGESLCFTTVYSLASDREVGKDMRVELHYLKRKNH